MIGLQRKLTVGAADDQHEQEADRVEAGLLSESQLGWLGGAGDALPGELQQSFEAQLGVDLSAVRVHTGAASAEMAESVDARAFAVGNDIHLGSGGSERSVMVHEVVHTVQKSGAAGMARKALVDEGGDAAEREADTLAERVVTGSAFGMTPRERPTALIHRDRGGSSGETSYVQGALPDLKFGAVVLGPSLRSDIAKMKRLGNAARAKRDNLDAQVQYLRMAADPKEGSGQKAVKAVTAAGKEAKHLSSGKKKNLKGAIDDYNTAKPKLRSLMTDIESARQIILEKTKGLESKVLAKDLKGAHRDKAKTDQDLADLQEKKASANKALDEFLGFATMLADPTKGWGSALDAAAGHVGSFLKDLAFGGTYATQIAAAQERLADIRRRIVGLEDRQIMADIEGATAGLNAARLNFQARVEDLKGVVYTADTAQEDLQKELGGLGKKGQAASAALSEGSLVIGIGNEAIAKSVELRGSLDELKSHTQKVGTQANYYREKIDDGLGDLRGNERAWAREAAIANVRNAGVWTQWVLGEMAHLQEAQDFLTGGSYRTPYEEGVENELTKIRRRL